MNHIKTSPVGIDKHIQKIQEKLYEKLGYTNIDGYGRVYSLEVEKKTIPAYFLEGNDYKDVLTDDKLNGQFFFVENEKTKTDGPRMETDIDIIFLLNLKKIKPSVPHRADEEARADISKVLDRIKTFYPKEIIKGKNALQDFDTELLDMQPYHFLKFTGTLQYQINC